MGFDLSLDTKSMAFVSNRTVFTIKWKSTLRKLINQSENFKEIEFVSNL